MDNNLQRYNALQRRLEHLERVHLDGKKAHQAETERLKRDLSRCQKTLAEQTDHIHKQKKHNDALESRIRDLKKAAITDHSEIKSLKAKAARDDLCKHITDLEAQLAGSRGDLKQRDERIAELEKIIETEKISNEGLLAARQELSDSQEDIATRLGNCKYLLSHAAEQYCQLVATTVPSSTHDELKRLYYSTQLKGLRLERKLASTEDQVQELVNLIRQINNRNDLLESHLADANHQLASYEIMFNEPLSTDLTVVPEPTQITEHHDHDLENAQTHLHELLATYYALYSQMLAFACTCIDKDLTRTTALAQQYSQDLASTRASHKATTTSLETVQHERSTISEELLTLKDSLTTLQHTCTSLENKIASFKDERQQLIHDHQIEIKNDRDAVQRLTSTVQKNRMAEDALRAEIDRLLAELSEAESYQEAYTALLEQVNSLLARNQLAEEEAERLGKFNAEIVGHNNPAQRISYVDRIRRELAEARQRVIVLTREQENMVQLNTGLQHELNMYKSVADKQKTHITRIQRAPLSNVTRIINPVRLELPPGEMTLDEIV